MNTEYIESGILELYVFGLLSEEENLKVKEMADSNEDVKAEILSIEKAVIDLSYSVSPYLSAEVYNKIRQQLIEKHEGVVQMPRKSTTGSYLGWAAAVILLFGLGFQYYQYNQATEEVQATRTERDKFEQMLANVSQENTQNEKALAIIRDKNNNVVSLAGQNVAPEAYAKVYLNNEDNKIYVDIAGLPEPPKDKVYQVWALKLKPQLTPTSIGVLDDSQRTQNKGIFAVENFEGAEAFGITLEPAGGSPSPTLEQLYTLGEVKS